MSFYHFITKGSQLLLCAVLILSTFYFLGEKQRDFSDFLKAKKQSALVQQNKSSDPAEDNSNQIVRVSDSDIVNMVATKSELALIDDSSLDNTESAYSIMVPDETEIPLPKTEVSIPEFPVISELSQIPEDSPESSSPLSEIPSEDLLLSQAAVDSSSEDLETDNGFAIMNDSDESENDDAEFLSSPLPTALLDSQFAEMESLPVSDDEPLEMILWENDSYSEKPGNNIIANQEDQQENQQDSEPQLQVMPGSLASTYSQPSSGIDLSFHFADITNENPTPEQENNVEQDEPDLTNQPINTILTLTPISLETETSELNSETDHKLFDNASQSIPDQNTIDGSPIADSPVVDSPVIDPPVADSPVVDSPVVDSPVVDPPVVDSPVADSPVVDAPVVDAPVVDSPAIPFPIDETEKNTVNKEMLSQDGSSEQIIPEQTNSEISLNFDNEVWFLSTECISGKMDDPDQIATFVYQDKKWEESDIDSFLTSNTAIPTIIFVHGYQTSNQEAVNDGFYLKYRLEQIQKMMDSPKPFRLVIWKWASERYTPHIRKDARYKSVLAEWNGKYLANLLLKMDSETPVTLIGFSFGSRTVSNTLETIATDPSYNPDHPGFNLILIAAANDYNDFGSDGKYVHSLSIINRFLNIYNPTDRVLKFYPLISPIGQRAPALGTKPIASGPLSNIVSINTQTQGKKHNFIHTLRAVPSENLYHLTLE